MTARLLHVSSEIGKELDSLADDVTFGVAPASIIFYELQVVDIPSGSCALRISTFNLQLSTLIPYLAFIVAAFSAVRLAKFNLDSSDCQRLPTPCSGVP